MILPLLITIALICANVYNAPPALYNTAQVAEWANCEPERVSYWIGQRIEYIEVKGWESANDCIERGYGDCKCMSIIARDVMKHCGYDSSVVTLHRSPLGSSAAHAIAVFAKGKTKGYINGSTTTFSEDLATVPGGPWN